jgi:predicted TPR repeat methyltransferase
MMKTNLLPLSATSIPQIQAWRIQSLFHQACDLFKHQQWESAACLFHYICLRMPDFKQGRFKLSICQMQLNFWSAAQQNLEQLLDIQFPDADIVCNLAICHWQQKHIKSALRLFNYNLKQFPHHVDSLENLASIFLQFNRTRQAISLYKQILGMHDKRSDIRFNLAACLQQLAIYDEAIMHYQILLNQQLKHPDYLYNLGTIYYNLGQYQACQFYWQQSLEINPNQKSLKFMLHMLDTKELDSNTHQSYVQELFDAYANHYDQHLMSQLNYQLPQFLNDYLGHKEYSKVLEIGCGTGLCGQILKSRSKQLIGVDLSQLMINKAEKKNFYDQLISQDAQKYLQQYQQTYDLIVAMDVVPYIKDLHELLKLMRMKLSSGGEILISMETNSTEEPQLESTGRITYPENFIHKICQELSLNIIFEKKIFARNQNTIPVMERIYHLKRHV